MDSACNVRWEFVVFFPSEDPAAGMGVSVGGVSGDLRFSEKDWIAWWLVVVRNERSSAFSVLYGLVIFFFGTGAASSEGTDG